MSETTERTIRSFAGIVEWCDLALARMHPFGNDAGSALKCIKCEAEAAIEQLKKEANDETAG